MKIMHCDIWTTLAFIKVVAEVSAPNGNYFLMEFKREVHLSKNNSIRIVLHQNFTMLQKSFII